MTMVMLYFTSCRSSTSPDFGVSGVLDRFHQINPKVIFSVEAVSYNMKIHDHLAKLREVVRGIGASLKTVVVVPFCTKHPEKIALEGKEILLDTFLEMAEPNPKLVFEQVSDADHSSYKFATFVLCK